MEQQHLCKTKFVLIQNHVILNSARAASLEQKTPENIENVAPYSHTFNTVIYFCVTFEHVFVL